METVYLFFAAVTVIGLIQWGKTLIVAIRGGGWAWTTPAAIPFVSALVAFVGGGDLNHIFTNAGIIWSLVQLCWDLILRGVYAIIKAVIEKLAGKVPEPELPTKPTAEKGDAVTSPPPRSPLPEGLGFQ